MLTGVSLRCCQK